MADFYSTSQASTVRRLATTAMIIGVVAVGGSILLDQTIKSGVPQIAIVRPDGSLMMLGGAASAQRALDMTPVGSIDKVKMDTVKIDPCTGQPKK